MKRAMRMENTPMAKPEPNDPLASWFAKTRAVDFGTAEGLPQIEERVMAEVQRPLRGLRMRPWLAAAAVIVLGGLAFGTVRLVEKWTEVVPYDDETDLLIFHDDENPDQEFSLQVEKGTADDVLEMLEGEGSMLLTLDEEGSGDGPTILVNPDGSRFDPDAVPAGTSANDNE